MENQTLMNVLRPINLTNNYKKALYFCAGVIIIGGVAYYVSERKNRLYERRISSLEQSNIQLTKALNSHSESLINLRGALSEMANEQSKLFNLMASVDRVIKDAMSNSSKA